MSSTGHFPGAPHNTDPVTTMASSVSETISSPSGAPHLPLQSVPFVHGNSSLATSQHHASATNAENLAADEHQATSSASNLQGNDHSNSVNPAAASVPSTITATTTTSSTSSTSTTTATANTAAPAPGRVSPVIPTEQLFIETIKRCNNCLFLIRKLRSKQDHIANFFLNNSRSERDFEGAVQEYRDFGTMTQEVMIHYEKLDQISRRLPKVVPQIENINVMRTLYTQEHTMCHININNLFEKMIDSGNWNEGNFQIFHYLSELLRVHGSRKADRYPEIKPLPKPVLRSQATTGHSAFEFAYLTMKREIINKSLGIYPKTLIQTACSLVVEFLFGCGGTKVMTDKDIVYTMKFLLVERNGTIEYINMIAATEDWKTINNFGTTTVDPYAPSRYEVYRRLTKQANLHLFNCFGTHSNRWSANTLIQFISIFGKFREVFTTRCRLCRRVLSRKNFMPPLIFDIRSPTHAAHEVCR